MTKDVKRKITTHKQPGFLSIKANFGFILLGVLFVLVVQLRAQDLIGLLPDSSQIAPFVNSEKAEIFEKENLYKYINGAADLYLEYGFKAVLTQQYVFEHSTFVLDIYEMTDSLAAFGIYSMFRDPTKPGLNIGQDGVEFDYQVSFWQDKYYVNVMGYENSVETKKMLIKTAGLVSDKLPQCSAPELLKKLSQKFKVDKSEGIINGLLALNRKLYLTHENLLNINGESNPAVFALYQSENGKAELLLVTNPKKQNDTKIVEDIFSKKYTLEFEKPFKIFKDQRNRYYAVHSSKDFLIFHKASSKQIILDILGQK